MAELKTLTLTDGTKIPYVSEEDYAALMTQEIEPALQKLRTEAEIQVSGGTLHAENYVIPGAKHALVLLHGYTESAEKFREMVWYFISAGYSVFSYDQRCHGRSMRLLEDDTIAHVSHFSDYVDDLETFIITCVRPAIGDLPLDLYAHSMGGGVGAQFLVCHPDTFRHAVLTSPMIAPSAGNIPVWVGYALARTMVLLGKGKSRAFIAGPFDADKEVLETSCSTSAARFDYYKAKRIAHPHLRTCAMTYGWVCESVKQTKLLLNSEKAGAVKTKVLLCQSGLDNMVRAPEQERFVELVPNARLARFDTARHEIYNSTDDVMQPYVRAVLDFLLKD